MRENPEEREARTGDSDLGGAGGGASIAGVTPGVAETVTGPIIPQLGLLEDDIVYRLSLLAVNVLEPLRRVYPNIVVKSGFRQANSGIGQHELGEAVDLQIKNQTPELLYEVACYIRDYLHYDQLVLNFSNVGDKQPWIHVSFSPNALRYQATTKDFSDKFHAGLWLVKPFNGVEAAAALLEQQALDKKILAELEVMSARQQRLAPTTSIGDEIAGTAPGGTHEQGSGTGGGDNNPDRIALVRCIVDAMGFHAEGAPYEEIQRMALEITKRVAWMLRDIQCGLLIKDGGENIYDWNGYSLSTQRVCFPDGQIYDILGGASVGRFSPTWQDNGMVDPSRYVPAMDPGDDGGAWTQCSVGNLGTGGGGGENPTDEDNPARA